MALDAEQRAAAAEADAADSQAESQRLGAELQKTEVELAGLRADAETRGAALTALQHTLGKIERSVDRQRNPTPPPGEFSAPCLW